MERNSYTYCAYIIDGKSYMVLFLGRQNEYRIDVMEK